MTRRRRTSLALGVAAAALVAALAAVLLTTRGTDSNSPAESVTLATPTAVVSALVFIADAEGYFSDEGVDVTLRHEATGKDALAATSAGAADLAAAAETPITFAAAAGVPVAIVSTIASSARDNAVVARSDRGIARAADLRGKRVGFVPGTSADFFLDALLVTNLLTRADIDIAELTQDEIAEALTVGSVDAVVTWQPAVSALEDALGSKAVTFTGDGIYTETFNLAGQRDWVRGHPAAVERVLRALLRAEELARESPAEAIATVAEDTGLPHDVLQRIWPVFDFRVQLAQSLVLTMEREARWIETLEGVASSPFDLLATIEPGPLRAVRPDAVTVVGS